MIKVDIAVNVTKDNVNAMIDCEDEILEELTEICKNIPAKCDDRLDESLANAVENEKMSSEDIFSVKNLTNVVNEGKNTIINSACKILEYNSNSRENVTVKSVIGETHLDASCRSSCLMAVGDISKSKIISEVKENLTCASKNVTHPTGECAEDPTNASEMYKCGTVGNVAMVTEDVGYGSFTDIGKSMNNGPKIGETMRDTTQNVNFAPADSSVSSNGDEVIDDLANTVANVIVSDIGSDGTKEGASFNSENNESPIEYQENSGHSFTQLEERKKPIEIKKPGKTVLSNTDNGESSVLFEPDFYCEEEAQDLFEILHDSTNWLDKNIVIHGVEYPQPRLVAWYGPLPYSYSGTTLEASEMPDCVLSIKRRVEDYLRGKNINVELNSVLLNLYRNNKDSVSWHSDDEFTMGVCPTIASISLGESRRFEMRPKPNRFYEDEPENKEYFVHLNSGSLIIMDGCMQEDWQHRVPKEYHDRDARINLTFRTVYAFEKGSPYPDLRVNNHKHVEREIPKNPGRNEIDLNDEENFPSLGSVSNNANSKMAHKSKKKTGYFSKMNDPISSSEEHSTFEISSELISRINKRMNAIEPEWVLDSPVSTKATTSHRTFDQRDDETLSNERDYPETVSKVRNSENGRNTTSSSINNASEEEWVLNSPVSTKALTTTSHRTFDQTDDELLSNERHYPENGCKATLPVKNNSKSEFGEINNSNYNLGISKESAHISQPSPQESNKSDKSWYDESCDSQILSEPDETNQLPEERSEKSLDYQQQTSYVSRDETHHRHTASESNKNYRFNEDYSQRLHHRRTPLESNKSFKFNEDYHENARFRRNPLESNKSFTSNEDYYENAHFRKTAIESNKGHRSNNDYHERAHQWRTPTEFNENRNWKSSNTRSNRFQSDKTDQYHEERDANRFNRAIAPSETNRHHRNNERGYREPGYKSLPKRERNFNFDERTRGESHNIGRRTVPNKNINGDEEEGSDRNLNLNSKERRDESSGFPEYHFQKRRFSDIRNEPPSRGNAWRPNVGAQEFIPGKNKKHPFEGKRSPSSVESSTFFHSSLNNLLEYDVDSMPSVELKQYAKALRSRVLDEISARESPDKEELEILCEITDGNQTDRNQKIICSRICALVHNTISYHQLNPEINPPVPRYPQQASYENE